MSGDKPETSLVDDALSILTKSGTLGKMVIMNAVEGYATTTEDLGEIFSGNKHIPVKDFKNWIEDTSGLNLTFGADDDPDERTFLENTGNFATDVVLDIFSSPDSFAPTNFITAPAKILKMSKFLPSVFRNETAMRTLQGAVLGGMMTQSDDDLTEILQKIGSGAALGSQTKNIFKGVGAANRFAVKRLDGIINGANREVFENYNKQIHINAKRGIPQRTKEIEEELINELRVTGEFPAAREVDDIYKSFEEASINRGEVFKPHLANKEAQRIAAAELKTQKKFLKRNRKKASALAQKEADEVSPLTYSEADNLSTQANRNSAGFNRMYNREGNKVVDDFAASLRSKGFNNEQIEKEVLNFRHMIANGQISIEKLRKKIFKEWKTDLSNRGIEFNSIQLKNMATKKANIETTKEVNNKLRSSPLLKKVVPEWVNFNRKMVDVFNADLRRRAMKLPSESERRTFLEKIVVGFDYHSLDQKSLDDGAEGAAEFVRQFGPKQRVGNILEVDPSISFKESLEVGANRYAGWFADASENEAKQLLQELYNTKDIRSPIRRLQDPKLNSEQKFEAIIEGFDKMTNLLKTKHLATSLSWVMNNYIDNIVKATIAAGPTTGLSVAVGIPMQGLVALGDLATAGRLRGLKEQNVLGKLLKAFDPTDTIAKVDFHDDMFEAALQAGAIDTNQFMDVFQLAKQKSNVLNLKVPKSKAKQIRDAIENTPTIEKALDNTQNLFWNTVGNFGGAVEGTARYITFDAILKTEMKKYPQLSKAVKEGRLGQLLEDRLTKSLTTKPTVGIRTKKELAAINTRNAEKLQLEQALEYSGKVTNDSFFDYSNVSSFEKHVMKRIFPYWTFWSKNMGLWLKTATDPRQLDKGLQALRPFTVKGEPLSEEQRARTPDYLIDKGARVIKDEAGHMEVTYAPSNSLIDALSAFQDPANDIAGRVNPIVKAAFELGGNEEQFLSNNPLFPTAKNPVKRLPESAVTALPTDVLEAVGIYRGNDGVLKTNNPLTAILLKAMDISPVGLAPPAIADQFARTMRDIKFKGKTMDEAIANNFFPVTKKKSIEPMKGKKQKDRTLRNIRKFEGGRDEVLGRQR